MKKDIKQIQRILSKVKYKDTKLELTESDGGFLLEVQNFEFYNMDRIHPLTLKMKWYLSSWSTDTEVVRTAYKAICDMERQVISHLTEDCTKKILRLLFKLGTDDKSYDEFDICARIAKTFQYKNWSLRTAPRKSGYLFQIVFLEKDNADPTKTEMQYCRKWFVDNDVIRMTYTPQILHVITEAIEAAEMHEINENFLYEGQTIYNPHMNLDGLVDFIKKTPFDKRPAPTQTQI